MLRNHFMSMTSECGDEFRNSIIIVRQGVETRKLIYKGKAKDIPLNLLDNKLLIISNENNKTCYIISEEVLHD